MLYQQLKWKFSLCWWVDCYNIDPGGQANYQDGHKIVFALWWIWIRTVECGILMIKKTVKTLQIRLYSDFLNVSIKHLQEKKLICL